jgi:hypothetical protein
MTVGSIFAYVAKSLNVPDSWSFRACSVMVCALAAIKAGSCVYRMFNGSSASIPSQVVQPRRPGQVGSSRSGFVGVEKLAVKQAKHLRKLQVLANLNQWEHLGLHTGHPHSGFDWWMFPIDQASTAHGSKYTVSQADINTLKQDPRFMESYRHGVGLVLSSWGWDVAQSQFVKSPHPSQRWTGYEVRLGKMIHSLWLFGETELLRSVKKFCQENKIRLQQRNQQYLDKI